MVHVSRYLAAVLAIILGGTAAQAAPCTSPGGEATVISVTPATAEGAQRIISMSMVMMLTGMDYQAASQRGTRCTRGGFSVGAGTYIVMGENDDHGGVRRAVPSRHGEVVAVLVPVTDIEKLVAASQAGGQAPVDGFLLITVAKKVLTGWRYYSAIPEDAVVSADMKAAIEQHLTPIFMTDLSSGKTNISVTPAATAGS